MPIVWRESMSVGNTLIDQDHRYLFCLVNTVELALRLEENAEVIEAALEQLVQYTRDHFAREETLQLKVRYPGYLEHKTEHQALLQRVAELQRQITGRREAAMPEADGEPAPAESETAPRTGRPVDPGEIAALLRHWVLDHVLKRDLELKAYLTRYPPGYT